MDAAFFADLFTLFCYEICLEVGADGEFQVEVDQIGDLVFVDGPKNQNGDFHVRKTQADPFLQMGHAEIINSSLPSDFPNSAESMAICIGFYRQTEQALPNLVSNERDIFFKLLD